MSYIIRLILFISIIGPFGALPAHGAEAFLGNLYNDSTLNFGTPVPIKPLPNDKLRLFVWNLHKGEDERLPQDFGDMSFGADIALFQECVSKSAFVKNIAAANPEFGWTMAKSFQMLDFSYTGVATGSRVKPFREEVIVSKVHEPITETPKTILLSEFTIDGSSETLLIANVHGINFVGLETYKVQMQQLFEKIKDHQGPLIVAGDFNTWEEPRIAFLKDLLLEPLKMELIQTPVAHMLDLDHIFVRGMKASFIFDLSSVDSSDHAPLMVDLTFEHINKVMKYEISP